MQPFSPFLIVIVIGVGLALGVLAFVRQPGPPLAVGVGSNTADALQPLKLEDASKLKLYQN